MSANASQPDGLGTVLARVRHSMRVRLSLRNMWNSDVSWGVPAKLLHWAIALLVLIQIGSGWAAVKWPLSPTKIDLYVWHKSIGMLILALMAVRVAWRLVNVTPALPAGTTAAERFAARASHLVMVLLLIAMPVTGWVINSAANIPFRIFWIFPLAPIVAPDKAVADTAARLHFALFVALSVLLVVHIGAALMHHLVKRDNVLARMLPGRGAAG
jgi:cytochrome b561